MPGHHGSLAQTSGGKALGRALRAIVWAALVCGPFGLLGLLWRNYWLLSGAYIAYALWVLRMSLRERDRARAESTAPPH